MQLRASTCSDVQLHAKTCKRMLTCNDLQNYAKSVDLQSLAKTVDVQSLAKTVDMQSLAKSYCSVKARDGTRVGTGTGKPGFSHGFWNPGFQIQNPETQVLRF